MILDHSYFKMRIWCILEIADDFCTTKSGYLGNNDYRIVIRFYYLIINQMLTWEHK